MPRGVYQRTEEHLRQMSKARKGKSIRQPSCPPGCTCGKHVRSDECRRKLSAAKSGRRADGSQAAGVWVDRYGYRILTMQWGHPLVTANGELKEHRKVLYDAIGPGPHECHWGCGKVLEWIAPQGQIVCVDHLDGDRLNNDPQNLVPSCVRCNWGRAKEDHG